MDIALGGISIFLSFLFIYVVVPFLKIHLSKKEIAFAKDIIIDIVASLEGENINGKDKKTLAIELAKKILKFKKINIPDMFLNALIESALYFLRKQFKKSSHRVQKEKGVIATYSIKNGVLN